LSAACPEEAISPTLDCALLMREVPVTWSPLAPMLSVEGGELLSGRHG